MYLKVLLLLHIGGAIIGFGPTFAFAVLGPLAGKLGGPQAVGVLKGIVKIEKALVRPFIILQPLTGALLIFKEGLDQDFFSRFWLWGGILLFAVAAYIATAQQIPAVEHLIELGESGKADTPEFAATVKKTQTLGPVLTLMLAAIIVLMILKPGS
ncbi:MAG: putative integral rane protein [Actinomycetota bacterium]|jgi:hypothetical protein|nr:putative integral rane protein [Actinomycetota bacterium]